MGTPPVAAGARGWPSRVTSGGAPGAWGAQPQRSSGGVPVQRFPAPGAPAEGGITQCYEIAENATTTITAPPGMVIVGFPVFLWGRPTGICGNYAGNSLSTTPQYLEQYWGATSVAVTASTAWMGSDPASGQSKWARITAMFGPESMVPKSGSICGGGAENATTTITVPVGRVITSIDFVSYGTPLGPCSGYVRNTCHATKDLSSFVGQRTITVPWTNAFFGGDPCAGTSKYGRLQISWGIL